VEGAELGTVVGYLDGARVGGLVGCGAVGCLVG